jgi:hypothetical protein
MGSRARWRRRLSRREHTTLAKRSFKTPSPPGTISVPIMVPETDSQKIETYALRVRKFHAHPALKISSVTQGKPDVPGIPDDPPTVRPGIR